MTNSFFGIFAARPAAPAFSGAGPNSALAAPFPPLIRDAAVHADALRELGAYPSKVSGRWRVSTSSLYHVMDGYFKRSRPFVSDDADFDSGLNFFFTNESDYPSAIGSIDGIGGAFIGVGRCVPISYAAWQRASHAYLIDKKFMIPMGFVPVYGSLLCMARNRAELVSLMTGRPLQHVAGTDGEAPERVCEGVMSRRLDTGFAGAVVSALAGVVAKNVGALSASQMRVALRDWIAKLERAFAQRRRWNSDEECPASILMNRDAFGRGGVLSSESAFRQERELFLQGRITGVAQNVINGGLESIAGDMGHSGRRLGAVYVSNIEDVLLFNYLFDERSPNPRTRPARVQLYYDFYRGLAGLPEADLALVISAKKRRITSVDTVARFVRRSIPLGLDVDSATNAAKDFYRMRVDVAFLKQFELADRVERLSRSLRSRHRFNVGMSVLNSMFEGEPVERSAFMGKLGARFVSAGLGRPGWWEEMFVSNLEELGAVRGQVNPS